MKLKIFITKKVFLSFILGIIEGLTEFFPISSTEHMILFNKFLNFTGTNVKTLEIVIQFGSVLAILLLFRRRFFRIIKFSSIEENNGSNLENFFSIWHIVLATCPSIFFGFLFQKQIRNMFDLKCMIFSSVAGGLFLLIGELLKHKNPKTIDIEDLSYLQSFFIGCFQCFSLFPGFSRSCATIAGGLLVGASRHVASEFSFILAVPTISGAALLEMVKNIDNFSQEDYFFCSIGVITAFLTSISVMRIFIRIIGSFSFLPFVIYRFILSIFLYILIF